MLEAALEHLVKGIVEHPDDVRVDLVTSRRGKRLEVRVHPEDLGKVIGRSGRTAKALRQVVAGIADRTAAEALRGTVLVVDSESLPPLADAEEWYDHQLIGLAAVTADGDRLGELTEVVHAPGCDLLVVRDPDGREHLVPFVREIVPTVDVPGGRVVVAAPEGLFDL